MSHANLPVPAGPLRIHDRTDGRAGGAAPSGAAFSGAAFDAHLLGQDGRRRGLKGGPPMLKAARAAYLEAEYSGAEDRRAPVGGATRAEA